jgi:hypothetical protein
MTNLICYCFGYTAQDILKDLDQNGRSLIMDKIMDEKRAGGCEEAQAA